MQTLVTVAFWIGTAFVVLALVRLWNAPLDHPSYRLPPWWPWSERWWQGYRRGLVPAAVTSLAIALTLTLPAPLAAPVGLVGIVAGVLLDVGIVLFNRPRFLVPPACRAQRGVLTHDPHEQAGA
jgi:hypothetical protein